MRRNTVTKISALVLIFAVLFSLGTQAAAGSDALTAESYSDIVTLSDAQSWGPGAFKTFGKVLRTMQNDGLSQPDSLLVGGDYSRLLPDYATLGILQLREQYVNVYPDADPEDMVFIQGNHDQAVASFCKTGMYDMGTYCLFAMNEDDFPWKQGDSTRNEDLVKSTAEKLDSSLNKMISSGDTRPVIVLTHVPLHFTRRGSYGDNLYSGYIFNSLNKAAEKLDIIYLFGHNHSDDYDDYIGGSVNFIAPGETIKIPDPGNRGENGFKEETLNFTYTNCGYVGYSGNGNTDTSTNVLAMGLIRLFEYKIEFVKYTEEGIFRTDNVTRVNRALTADMSETTSGSLEYNNPSIKELEIKILTPFIRLYMKIFGVFDV